MAIIRAKEARKLSAKEAADKISELKKELIKLRAQSATGTNPQSPGKIKLIKKTIARLLTCQLKTEEEQKNNE